MSGWAPAAKSVEIWLYGVVVNDHVTGSAIAIPPVSLADSDAVYVFDVASGADGVKVAVRDGPSYVTAPATVLFAASFSVNWIVAGLMSLEKVAVAFSPRSTLVC